MSAHEAHRLEAVLSRYVSPITARGSIARVQASRRPASAAIADLVGGVRIYIVDPQRREALERELRATLETREVSKQTLVIAGERDVGAARQAARSVATDLGASSLLAQKIATAASELTRNIVMYAGRGELELGPVAGARRGLLLVARDRGPGIRDLDLVLSGAYRSKTGLGAGLRGVKRLADRFSVQSGATGTVVEFEAWI